MRGQDIAEQFAEQDEVEVTKRAMSGKAQEKSIHFLGAATIEEKNFRT